MKIFVSSTFADLSEYRDAAIRGLRQTGHEVIAMEDFTASTAPPVQRVIELVDEAEVYVGIFAWRYGYIPLAADLLATQAVLPDASIPGATSITHLEYLQAKEKDKEILAFLLDERTPWPPVKMDAHSRIDDVGGEEQEPVAGMDIEGVRSELRRERIVATFTSANDLEARVVTAVTNLGMGIGLRDNLEPIGCPVEGLTDSSHANDIQLEIMTSMSTDKRFTTIDLATEWWSTRLFILAALADRFTDIERIVIIRGVYFIGMVSVDTVLRRLASTNARLSRFTADLTKKTTSLPPDQALVAANQIWDDIFPIDAEAAAQAPVSEPNLDWWFGDAMFRHPIIVENLNEPTILDLNAILAYPNDYVPVLVERDDDATEPIDAPAPADPEASPTIRTDIQIVDKRSLNAQFSGRYIADLMKKAKLA